MYYAHVKACYVGKYVLKYRGARDTFCSQAEQLHNTSLTCASKSLVGCKVIATKSFRYKSSMAVSMVFSERNFPTYCAFIFSTQALNESTAVVLLIMRYVNFAILHGSDDSALHFYKPELVNWSSMADRNNHENGNLQANGNAPTFAVVWSTSGTSSFLLRLIAA